MYDPDNPPLENGRRSWRREIKLMAIKYTLNTWDKTLTSGVILLSRFKAA
jgi:hypothetical protein